MYLFYIILAIALFILWLIVLPNYKKIIKRAWQITWQNKILWAFGFFAVLLGTSGELDIIINRFSDINKIPENLFTFQTFFEGGIVAGIANNVIDFFANFPFQAILLSLLLLVLFAIVVWLVIVAQIGLIYNILKANNNEKAEFKEGFRQGRKYFWPVFWLNLLSKIVIYGLLLLVSLPLIVLFILKSSLISTVVFTFFAFVVFVPLSVIIAFIIKYSIIFIVYKNFNIKEAIKASIQLFKKYWLISIEMAFLIYGFAILSALALIVILILLISPFFLLGIFGILIKAQAVLTAAIILGLIVIFISALIYGGIFATFQYSNWTLLFLDLVKEEKIGSKVVRIIGKIFPFLARKKF